MALTRRPVPANAAGRITYAYTCGGWFYSRHLTTTSSLYRFGFTGNLDEDLVPSRSPVTVLADGSADLQRTDNGEPLPTGSVTGFYGRWTAVTDATLHRSAPPSPFPNLPVTA